MALWRYPAVVQSVIDGDTLDLVVSLGFYVEITQRFRLIGSIEPINTPELHARNPAERARAQAAKARVIELAPPGTAVVMRSEKGPKVDGFHRWIAELVLPDGRSLGDVLLAEGLADIWKP